jgi:uncharacterized protein YwgA
MTERRERWQLLTAIVRGLNEAGAASTRTQIQKLTYLLSRWSEREVPYSFVLHLHGPYSFDLDRDIAGLEAFRLVAREDIPGTLGGRYFATKGQDATLDDEIRHLARWLGGKSSRELEALATCEYAWTADPDKTSAKVHAIKPHLSPGEIASAYAELAEARDAYRGAAV